MSTIEKVMQRVQRRNPARPADAKRPDDAAGESGNGAERLRVVEHDRKLPLGADDKSRINLEDLNLEGYLDPNNPDPEILEEYRRVKRPLVINALEPEGPMRIDKANLIMITSSLPGEGKTYSAANLAFSISMEKDISVLLIDCDIHRKSLSKLFRCNDAPGILDYLDSPLMDLSEVMVDLNVPNLNFIPAGAWRRDSAELMAGLRMVDMTQELSERYEDRVVIFDSPPLLSCNDSSVLARYIGQVAMVVEAQSTRRGVVNEALSRLPEDRFVGLVFNKASKQDGAGYYGPYYGPLDEDADGK